MSLVKANAAQIGQSVTATNNFTMYQPASPDGTVRWGVGNSGSVTDIVTLNSSGYVGIGTSSPAFRLDILGSGTLASGSMRLQNYAGQSLIDTYVAEGTSASPSPTTSGRQFFAGRSFGYDGSSWIQVGRVQVQAESTFSVGSTPSYFTVATCPVGGTVTERMRLDSSGNLGLGVTPSAWATYKVFQMPAGSIGSYATSWLESNQNGYWNNSTFVYVNTGYASRYVQTSGEHRWSTAPSGTAGNPITFTQAMTLDASGNLGVGTTTSLSRITTLGTSSTVANGASTRNPIASIRGGNDNNRLDVYVDNSGATAIMGLGAYNTAGGATAMTFYTGASVSEAMRIDSSGNVGIGTSSPTTYDGKTVIVKTSSAAETVPLSLVNSDGAVSTAVSLGFAPNINIDLARITALRTNADGSTALVFKTYNGSSLGERMRIDSSGRLLVATASTFGLSPTAQFYANGSSGLDLKRGSDAGSIQRFYNYNGTQVGSVDVGASTTSYVTSSDYRLKENIQPMQNALGVVAQLNPVTYTWKADGSDGQGFIAHELQAVVPDCVTGEKDAVDDEGNPVYQGIDTSFLVATLTAAIQEQQAIIELLTQRIEQLEAK